MTTKKKATLNVVKKDDCRGSVFTFPIRFAANVLTKALPLMDEDNDVVLARGHECPLIFSLRRDTDIFKMYDNTGKTVVYHLSVYVLDADNKMVLVHHDNDAGFEAKYAKDNMYQYCLDATLMALQDEKAATIIYNAQRFMPEYHAQRIEEMEWVESQKAKTA